MSIINATLKKSRMVAKVAQKSGFNCMVIRWSGKRAKSRPDRNWGVIIRPMTLELPEVLFSTVAGFALPANTVQSSLARRL